MIPSPSRCTTGAAVCRMMALERVDVALPFLDPQALVRLEQRGVADHVGEHHGDEPPLERFGHGATFTPGRGRDHLGSSRDSGSELAGFRFGQDVRRRLGRPVVLPQPLVQRRNEMHRQNLFADGPWDVEDDENGLLHRIFWRPHNARMGASLWQLTPGTPGMKWHMHYGAEEMFFVLSGHPVFRTIDGEVELGPGDFVFCPEGRLGLHAYGNRREEPARILAISAGGFPDVVAYPEHGYAWVATRDPDLAADPTDPGIIQRFDFRVE